MKKRPAGQFKLLPASPGEGAQPQGAGAMGGSGGSSSWEAQLGDCEDTVDWEAVRTAPPDEVCVLPESRWCAPGCREHWPAGSAF